MLPLTMLVSQKLASLLTGGSALQQEITTLAQAARINVPAITPGQVVITAAAPGIADKDVQLTYPRVCIYSLGVKNTQAEKFRTLSGSVSVVADLWASAALVNDCDVWIHYYVEAFTTILRKNFGDWGDGVFFAGSFNVQFQAPQPGGLGFVESAKVTCVFAVSQN